MNTANGGTRHRARRHGLRRRRGHPHGRPRAPCPAYLRDRLVLRGDWTGYGERALGCGDRGSGTPRSSYATGNGDPSDARRRLRAASRGQMERAARIRAAVVRGTTGRGTPACPRCGGSVRRRMHDGIGPKPAGVGSSPVPRRRPHTVRRSLPPHLRPFAGPCRPGDPHVRHPRRRRTSARVQDARKRRTARTSPVCSTRSGGTGGGRARLCVLDRGRAPRLRADADRQARMAAGAVPRRFPGPRRRGGRRSQRCRGGGSSVPAAAWATNGGAHRTRSGGGARPSGRATTSTTASSWACPGACARCGSVARGRTAPAGTREARHEERTAMIRQRGSLPVRGQRTSFLKPPASCNIRAMVLPFARVGSPRRAVGSGSGARAAPYVARRVRVPKGYGRTWIKRSGYASSRPAHVAARRDGAAGGSSEGRFA